MGPRAVMDGCGNSRPLSLTEIRFPVRSEDLRIGAGLSPGIEFGVSIVSVPTVGPTQPPIQLQRGNFPGCEAAGA